MKNILQKLETENTEFLMFVLDEIAEDMENSGSDVIRLTLGKSQEQLNQKILTAYINAIQHNKNRDLVYPQGLPLLREKIAEWYTSLGNPVNPSSVVINTGTSPLFKDLFRFLLGSDDEILLPYPYYSVYNISALLTSAQIKYYKIDTATMKIDMDSFQKNYSGEKTKIVVLNSPGNPIGNIIAENEFKNILDLVNGQSYILSDEIYRNVGFKGKVPSILDVSSSRDKVIISNSFSKGFRMYTTRVGFFILPDELVKPFRILLQHTLLATNSASQFACVEALNHLSDVEELSMIYSARNQYAIESLGEINKIKVIESFGGFYFVICCDDFMKHKGFSGSLELASDLLKVTGVAVVPGSDFGMDNALRISFTNLRFKEGIDRMAQYFSN